MFRRPAALLVIAALVVAACGGGTGAATPASGGYTAPGAAPASVVPVSAAPVASATPAPAESTSPSAPVDRDYGTATPAPTVRPAATPAPTVRPVTTPAPTAPPAATPAPTAPPAGGAVAVAIASFTFAPGNLAIPAGTTVTWTNSDSAPHSVKSTDGGFESSGTLAKGGTYSLTFPTAGTFPYVCGIHPSMQGTVTVGP
ncbi:MAG TPA: cupredoxin domain-containing protein [Candidatus Sulfomarinibacteraceae bacterium]|nr:cupredoxin domain-containing protein [Candidatus Sulfomarinibacteraceae bacterium]